MESIIRAFLIYAVLLLLTRLSGRRALSQMTPFDMVLLMVVAETTQQALLAEDPSITHALLLILTLFAADVALSLLKGVSPRIERLIQGVPTVLVSNGQLDAEALRRARIGLAEVLEAARQQQGLRSFAEIDFAVLEVDGKISIIPARPDTGP